MDHCYDAPGSLVEKGGATFDAASFSTWLMCKPKGADGCWVPLQKINWGFVFLATWLSGPTPTVFGDGHADGTPVPGTVDGNDTDYEKLKGGMYNEYLFGDTSEFPTWSKVIPSPPTLGAFVSVF